MIETPTLRCIIAVSFGLVSSVISPGHSSAGDLDDAINFVLRMNEAAAKGQKKVDQLDDETGDLLGQYRTTQQRIESLKIYNSQVGALVEAQRKQLSELGGKLEAATNVGREITPLLIRMLDVLEQFIKLDLPFLLNERTERIAKLREMMGQPDVTEAEKYRRILEAYQIENDFGRTIESYQGELAVGEQKLTVSFLRVGRISLVYQTLDGEKMGVWDRQKGQWVDLPQDYYGDITRGLRIAKKQAPPDLIFLPVQAPEAVTP